MKEKTQQNSANRLPEAETGNASNPTPHDDRMTPAGGNQFFDEKAETYLRESANIEDLPDPQEEQDAENALSQEGN